MTFHPGMHPIDNSLEITSHRALRPAFSPQRPRWTRVDTIIVILLVAVSALLRLYHLSEPSDLVFDETYYAKDACLYAGFEPARCGTEQATEQSYVHPPAGKWLIAVGVRLFGFDSFGWRLPAALIGTAAVILVFLLARRLYADRWVATVAGALTATDLLSITQSRIAMLDIFVTFFIVLGFLFLAHDREKLLVLREHQGSSETAPRREPEWRFAAGAAFGLAVATKWSGAIALVVAVLLAMAWSAGMLREYRRRGEDPPVSDRRETLNTILAFMLVPAIVYLATYAHWFADNLPFRCDENSPADCRNGVAGTAAEFYELQRTMLSFHSELKADHPYGAPAWKWPLVLRPIAYYYAGPPDRPNAHHILAFGNPAVWWAALAAAGFLLVGSRRNSSDRFVLAAWWGQYLPWLAVPRVLFFFYMTPIAPFMMIGLARVLGTLRKEGRLARFLIYAYLVLGVGVLLYYFYPVVAGLGLPRHLWRGRMWFDSWI